MKNNLQGFDPLLFLGITNVKNKEKNDVSKKLLNKISQYLVIRITELLPEDELKHIEYPQELFSVAKNRIPDLDNKVKQFLEDFKKEFSANLQQL